MNRPGDPGLIFYVFEFEPVVEKFEQLPFLPGMDVRRAAGGDRLAEREGQLFHGLLKAHS